MIADFLSKFKKSLLKPKSAPPPTPNKSREAIKLPILAPLAVAVLVLLIATIGGIRWLQHREITYDVETTVNTAQEFLHERLDHDAKLISGMMDFLKQDKNLQKAFLAKDREALLKYAAPIFEDIRPKYRVTHFYFHELDRICFLRVHNPSRHGDYIKRFTMSGAIRENGPFHGIELGPLGTFSLRVVHPWYADGRLIGYLELGEEIEHITPELKKIVGAELVFTINKTFLKRPGWEEGMKMLNRNADWDQFPNFVVIGQTMPQIPQQIEEKLQQLDSCSEREHIASFIEASSNERIFEGGFVPLIDAGRHDVGDMIVLKDITGQHASLRLLSAIMVAVSTVVGALIITLFYFYIGRIERKLESSRSDLEREIDQREQTQIQLLTAKREWEDTFDSINDAITIQDTDYNIVRANKATQDILKIPFKDLLGQKCYQIYHGLDQPPAGCPSCDVYSTGEPCTYEIFEPHLDRYIQIKAMPQLDEKGNVTRIIHVVDDITQRKQVEEELKQLNEQLESSTENANTLAQDATIANQTKSEFLANMSHEIRTPMNAIIGFGEILAEENLNDEQGKYVETIRNSGHHLLELINDILDFSKIEAGKLEIEIVESSLEQILAEIDSLLRPMAIEKGLEFEVVSSDQLPKNINTDPARLRQCLINLANNAIKFTEQGHVYVNASVEYQNDDNPFIRFDVEDTGVGVESEKLKTIFDAFAQADASTTRKFGGTGLGLAITKQLAELLGGSLSLTSRAGKGSVFTLLVPAQIDTQTSSGDRSTEDPSQASDTKTWEKLNARILVAEDNPSNQMFIETLLKKAGCQALIVSNGQEAIDKARAEQFDLILMDMHMPNVNGYQAAETLRKEGLTTPIIALTADAMEGDKEKCLQAGCDDYLAKPLDKGKFYQTIARYITAEVKNKE